MSAIEVQLNAYVLPIDHKIWKCHPGKTYRFYQAVREANAVFLDIRGLTELPGDPETWDDKATLKLLAYDRWTRELNRIRYDGKPKGSPEISKIDHRNLTFLKGLLFEAKKGDIIVIPAEGWRRDVLIGEFLDEPGVVKSYEARDDDATHTYIGRAVKWRAMQEKRYFSSDLVTMLHTPTAFFALPKSLHEEIYRIAYENFIIGDLFSATFSTSKQHFSTSDSAIIGTWFNALSAVRGAIENGKSIDDLSYLDLGLRQSDNPTEGELAININSPGEYILRSTGPFALAVMGLYPLMSVDAQQLATSSVRVHLQTVGSADDSCSLRVEQSMKGMIDTLSISRLQEACKVGKRAESEATLRTSARLKSATKGYK